MADFLIKNTDHWMDVLTTEEVQTRISAEKAQCVIDQIDPPVSKFETSYNQRYQKGDVLEIAKNGRWDDHRHGNGKFLIIRVPFLPVEMAQEYINPLLDGEENTLKRRRYRMWFENITAQEMADYQVAPYVYQVNTEAELLTFGQDKLDEI